MQPNEFIATIPRVWIPKVVKTGGVGLGRELYKIPSIVHSYEPIEAFPLLKAIGESMQPVKGRVKLPIGFGLIVTKIESSAWQPVALLIKLVTK